MQQPKQQEQHALDLDSIIGYADDDYERRRSLRQHQVPRASSERGCALSMRSAGFTPGPKGHVGQTHTSRHYQALSRGAHLRDHRQRLQRPAAPSTAAATTAGLRFQRGNDSRSGSSQAFLLREPDRTCKPQGNSNNLFVILLGCKSPPPAPLGLIARIFFLYTCFFVLMLNFFYSRDWYVLSILLSLIFLDC